GTRIGCSGLGFTGGAWGRAEIAGFAEGGGSGALTGPRVSASATTIVGGAGTSGAPAGGGIFGPCGGRKPTEATAPPSSAAAPSSANAAPPRRFDRHADGTPCVTGRAVVYVWLAVMAPGVEGAAIVIAS